MELVVAVTGASGSVYARRFLEVAREPHCSKVNLIVSDVGKQVIAQELGIKKPEELLPLGALGVVSKVEPPAPTIPISIHDNHDLLSPIASGSARWEAMVIVPCSAGTLGRIASGHSDSLITRAADVALKERRPLILVLRETPLSQIHIRNMLTLCEAGAVILPASPAFYHSPKDVGGLVDFIVQRICDSLGWDVQVCPPWRGASSS